MLARLRYYVPYAWRFTVTRTAGPLIYGLAVTDRCNLSCRGCHVSNNGQGDLTYAQIAEKLDSAYRRGCRELYFTGGEPLLWRDGERTLEDAIALARAVGYFHVHVYTNGTQGLNSSADLVWVSMDGLPGTYETRRGDHFAEVEGAVRALPHPKTIVIYVIDRSTASGIGEFLRWVRDTCLPVEGVMVYFHTPYYGMDELYLDAEERAVIIDGLLALKREGLPLINSRAGLRALQSGDWPRRMPVALVADVDGESVCCRASDDVCPDCGYAACTELSEAQRLRPSAVAGMVRYL
jgi:Fe-coproporphyrin III synthase